jgi:hypothetical protein
MYIYICICTYIYVYVYIIYIYEYTYICKVRGGGSDLLGELDSVVEGRVAMQVAHLHKAPDVAR